MNGLDQCQFVRDQAASGCAYGLVLGESDYELPKKDVGSAVLKIPELSLTKHSAAVKNRRGHGFTRMSMNFKSTARANLNSSKLVVYGQNFVVYGMAPAI